MAVVDTSRSAKSWSRTWYFTFDLKISDTGAPGPASHLKDLSFPPFRTSRVELESIILFSTFQQRQWNFFLSRCNRVCQRGAITESGEFRLKDYAPDVLRRPFLSVPSGFSEHVKVDYLARESRVALRRWSELRENQENSKLGSIFKVGNG